MLLFQTRALNYSTTPHEGYSVSLNLLSPVLKFSHRQENIATVFLFQYLSMFETIRKRKENKGN